MPKHYAGHQMKNNSSSAKPKGNQKMPRPKSSGGPLTTQNATGSDGKNIGVPYLGK